MRGGARYETAAVLTWQDYSPYGVLAGQVAGLLLLEKTSCWLGSGKVLSPYSNQTRHIGGVCGKLVSSELCKLSRRTTDTVGR